MSRRSWLDMVLLLPLVLLLLLPLVLLLLLPLVLLSCFTDSEFRSFDRFRARFPDQLVNPTEAFPEMTRKRIFSFFLRNERKISVIPGSENRALVSKTEPIFFDLGGVLVRA